MPTTADERVYAERSAKPEASTTRTSSILAVSEARWAALATLMFACGGVAQVTGAPTWSFWALYLACYVTGGWEPTVAGLAALRQRTLDVDVLMIVAAIAAAAIGQVFDGALLIVIFATSGALEAVATRRTQESVRSLLTLAPERARRLKGRVDINDHVTGNAATDADEEVVDTSELVIGDCVLVRPGERIGADGIVISGISEVDQATITGEPLPVTKQVGDGVFAGTLNGDGALTLRVEHPAAETVLARIIDMVNAASQTKATTQMFIERVEQRYSVTVVAATLLLLGVPLAFGASFESSLLRAMTFMIVASPCAVVLATMPPLLAVMANAGRHGLLLKSAVALEKLSQINQIAFDKTGTLTHGTPRVATIQGIGCDAEELLRTAAAAEQHSEHPVGRAILAAARERRLTIAPCTNFRSTTGRGVRANLAGRTIEVGSPHLLLPTAAGDASAAVGRLETLGQTAVIVLAEREPVGVLGLTDRPREDASGAVRRLTDLTEAPPILLTGDNYSAAAALADQVHITSIRANLLPGQKASTLASLQTPGHHVAFVGDGINDAPALATAHVGIAMGTTGSDLALDTAEVVLVRNDLALLPTAIALARRAQRVVKANLAFAATVITVLVIWDIGWTLPLPLGVAGHEGSTIVVALNGLRLLRTKAWCDA